MVMKYQMKNGSLFNSPSATAAALIHHQDDGCLNYLISLLDKFGNAVPTIYPFDLYIRLSMVDTLERLGVARHFKVEIQNVLDETYRCWVQRDEQIFSDVVTCALAFRLLRTNGYQVSSDPLAEITKEEAYLNPLEEPFKDVNAALQVYKASEVIYQEESAFGELNLRSADFLKQNISTNKEVDIALKFPFYARLDGLCSRGYIEHYNVDNTRILKTTYRSPNISNEDYLRLAVEDFNACQSTYQGELKVLERWVVDYRIDQLNFARQKTAYCYFGAVSTLSSPELTDVRLLWAKHSLLTSIIDDFYDDGGSLDELVNLTQAIEKWDVNVDTDCCSEHVRILFLALKDAVCTTVEKAFKLQERDVTSHVVQIWLDVAKTMLQEAIWARDGTVPTLNEYIENSYMSFALGPIVLPSLYLIGPKLSEEIVQSSEYLKLEKLLGTHGRLLNDMRSFKRELEAGQLNAVTLSKKYGNSKIEEEEAVEEVKLLVKKQERELMKLVLEDKGSVVPGVCKDLFWKMCSIVSYFYATDDGYTGNAILKNVKEIMYEPVSHNLMLMNGTDD